MSDSLEALCDPALTTVVLVTRADAGAIGEASRTSNELQVLGLHNQRLVINGVFHATDRLDTVAEAIEGLGTQALNAMPANLRALPPYQVPLRAFDTVGLAALRALLPNHHETEGAASHGTPEVTLPAPVKGRGLDALADELALAGHGLIMVMGKGGIGKTTVAAALALGLVQHGKTVHLSTTDPAAHLTRTLEGTVEGLRVDRIDPVVETQRYIEKIMATKGAGLDAQERALMLEDLQSPCTEEVAVFHAFSTQALQEDLRRAKIEPFAWVINKSVLAAGTHDPLLRVRLAGEVKQEQRIANGLSKKTFVVPWLAHPPVGVEALSRLVIKLA